MTTTQHFTTAQSWSVPAGVTRARAVVAGGHGLPYTDPTNQPGGLGAIVRAIIPVSGSVSIGVGARAGGPPGSGYGGYGGAASVVGPIVAGGGGGQGSDYYASTGPFKRAGSAAGQPGMSAGGGSDGNGFGGDADGSGGAGGVYAGATTGGAGQSDAAGGNGGVGTNLNNASGGGGGGGFGGGGGGAAGNAWSSGNYGGFGGGGGSSTGGTYVGGNPGAPYVDLFWAAAPLMPTLFTPTGNMAVDRTQPIPLTFQHNGASADVLDVQSSVDVRHRKVGAGSWTTVSGLGLATSSSIAANTYGDGDQVEWQVRTYADGVQGPWSASEYFTAQTPPTTPVVTTPVPNATIGTATLTAAWTHAGQVMFQYRAVEDVAGVAGSLVYADTGPVTSAALTATLTVTVNTVTAHGQVRVKDTLSGLWSHWADVKVSISWEPPPTPTVYQRPDPEHGSIVMVIANPAPTGVQPAASVNRVYVTEGGIEQRRAIIAPGADWEYWVPVGEVGVRVEAVDESTGVMSSTEVIW